MATKYASVVAAAAAAQDPNALDTIVTADTGATAVPDLSSGDGAGGTTTKACMGFAGVIAVLDDTSYDDDADNSIGSGGEFAPGHGTNTQWANEKLSSLGMGGILPGGTQSQGTLTIAEPVTDGDTFTIGSITYTLKDTPAAAFDVEIGASEAETKVNIVAAINLSGTPGTEYFAGTTEHPDVSAAAFSGDDCVLTAKEGGVAGDSIATTETFTHVSNVFDAATLGTTTAGKDFEWAGSLEPIGISADVALVDQN